MLSIVRPYEEPWYQAGIIFRNRPKNPLVQSYGQCRIRIRLQLLIIPRTTRTSRSLPIPCLLRIRLALSIINVSLLLIRVILQHPSCTRSRYRQTGTPFQRGQPLKCTIRVLKPVHAAVARVGRCSTDPV
jgi:hypothetical protein